MTIGNQLGANVKRVRKLGGMTAYELGEATHGIMTRATIANLETGRKKDITTAELLALCRALQVTVDAIVPELAPYVPNADEMLALRMRIQKAREVLS